MATHQAPPSLGFSRQEYWSGLPFPSLMHESEKWKWSCSVVSDSSRPHGLQPTRLLRPWGFPGKSTGVGCHCLLRLSSLGHANLSDSAVTSVSCFLVNNFSRLKHCYLWQGWLDQTTPSCIRRINFSTTSVDLNERITHFLSNSKFLPSNESLGIRLGSWF